MPSCENSELFTSNCYHKFSHVGIVACALQQKEMCHENFSWWMLCYQYHLDYQIVSSSPKSFVYVNTVSSYSWIAKYCCQYATVSEHIKLWDWKFIVWAETIIWIGKLHNGFITLIPRRLYLNIWPFYTLVLAPISLPFWGWSVAHTKRQQTDKDVPVCSGAKLLHTWHDTHNNSETNGYCKPFQVNLQIPLLSFKCQWCNGVSVRGSPWFQLPCFFLLQILSSYTLLYTYISLYTSNHLHATVHNGEVRGRRLSL